MNRELIIKDTHRGLWYEDGVLVKIVEAGRYEIPGPKAFPFLGRTPKVEIVLMDIRERDLTIKGQEILTSDKVAILLADVKDLVFPGNLQEIMNKVLGAERLSQARLIESRSDLEKRKLEAANEAEIQILRSEADAKNRRAQAEAEAELHRIAAEAEQAAMQMKESVAKFYEQHPVMLRLKEIEALSELGRNAAARLYINMEKLPAVGE